MSGALRPWLKRPLRWALGGIVHRSHVVVYGQSVSEDFPQHVASRCLFPSSPRAQLETGRQPSATRVIEELLHLVSSRVARKVWRFYFLIGLLRCRIGKRTIEMGLSNERLGSRRNWSLNVSFRQLTGVREPVALFLK
jgi:hypothetical protein